MENQYYFPDLAALVMAGGKSSRMGTDKALLRFNNGPTLLDLACAKAATLARLWHVSCARGKDRPGYPCLQDEQENFGPLAGILKGLENAQECGCHNLLVLACDLPLMPTHLLARLIALHMRQGREKLLAVYENSTSGMLEMQAAVYNVHALPLFGEAAAQGRRRLSTIIPGERQLRLSCPPEFEYCFLNCNSPADLREAEELIRRNPGLLKER